VGWLIKSETGGQKRGIEKKPDKIFDGLVELVLFGSLLELDDDWMVGVELHSLLGDHVGSHRGISEGLSLHDSLHVSGPTVLTSDQNTWGVSDSLTNLDFLDLITKDFLDKFAEWLERGFLLFEFLLLILGILEVKTFFGAVLKLLTIVLLELLDDVLIDWIDHVKDFKSSLLELLNEWRVGNSLFGFTSDEEDVFLTFLHSRDVVFKGDHLFTGGRGVISQKFGDLLSVGGVLVDTELKVLGELLVELFVVLSILSDLSEELKALLGDVFLDDLKDLVLLKELPGDVQWKIFGVDYTLDKGEIVWDEILTVIHNEDSSDVKFDVVLLLFGLKEVKWSSLWNVKDRSEF